MRHDWHVRDEISEVIKYPCTQFLVRTFSVTSEHEPIKLLFMLPLPPLGKQQSQNDCGYFTVRVIFYNWHLGLLSLPFSIPLEFPLILLMSMCIYWTSTSRWGGKSCRLLLLIDWVIFFFFSLYSQTASSLTHGWMSICSQEGHYVLLWNCIPVIIIVNCIFLYIWDWYFSATDRLTA